MHTHFINTIDPIIKGLIICKPFCSQSTGFVPWKFGSMTKKMKSSRQLVWSRLSYIATNSSQWLQASILAVWRPSRCTYNVIFELRPRWLYLVSLRPLKQLKYLPGGNICNIYMHSIQIYKFNHTTKVFSFQFLCIKFLMRRLIDFKDYLKDQNIPKLKLFFPFLP